ncbi:bifunctional diguanylate cyclase/phosphodiesterase [Halanaerobium sp. ST460_2HS_T2]|jgi:diguanylate cyclase (GGDEF)-like protein|uniref:putative bifunctional diguanylate cyclase/phosphodiesterase n=1 Tax=Halanaerobium sp. ST460_2HS_T2 TaxID=2183914 RepID=UPI000DF34606|nr:GGDEF domain-containing phosphodiesterase [Halanaerobium sp. ST460_2HS_T2]RCW57335.1 diguanylate cyclase (GGDEF)-like protein [Halanaerobium sp. ST460_2HS_T2]
MLKKQKNMKKDLIVEDELYLLAYFDQLTMLPNEKYFYEELVNNIENEVGNEIYAVAYLKINDLEKLHNILGFEKINNFVKLLAEQVQKINKNAELISLYRGNQFLILYKPDNIDNLKKRLAKTLKYIKDFIAENNYDYLLNINLGAAIYPEHGNTAASLLTKAHNAMYTIKENRNTYQIYNEKVYFKKIEKEVLKHDLKNAIENNDFYLKYQPKVQTVGEKITALEALIRWEHEEKGIISPAKFIPLAEKTGLIKNIGIFVLKEAFETLKLWKEKGLTNIKICINISLSELNDQEIIKNIKYIADAYSIDNSLIEFEITERSFTEIKRETLDELKNMGFSIALDDFGTGYSSLSFLNELSIDVLKLDKSFIDNITEEKTKMLVRGIIEISHNLNIKVVAEGAEVKEQLEILKELNCDYIQGYYYYRPMAKNKIEKLLN